MAGKIIIIGLDGASPELFFNKWADEFPNIQKIIKKGAHGTLKSVIPTSTGPAWTSFATGCSPEKHGIFNFVYPDKNLDNIRPNNSSRIASKTFYELLEEKNKKCVLINLPNSYPPKTKNITITSLLTSGDEFIFPKELKDEIPEFSRYRISPNNLLLDKGKLKEYIDDIQELENVRFQCAKKLFNKDWEVFFMLFSGTDWIQHQAYDKMINETKNNSLNKRIIRFYKELDSYIGWFLDNKNEEDTMFIISDHGFDTYKGYFYVNSIFEKAKLLSYKKVKSDIKTTKIKEDTSKNKIRLNLGWLIKILRKNDKMFKLSKKVYQKVTKIVSVQADINLAVDTKKTKVAALRGTEDCIYLNKEGNFSDYTIKKNDFVKFKRFIINILKNLKSPSGKKVFRQVIETKSTLNDIIIPDILIDPDEYYMSPGISPEVFSKETLNKHSQRGIIAAIGPGIRKNTFIKNYSLIDLTPTLLKLLKIEIPKNMDGKYITEIIK